jgi:curved DNA-binding protein CbpA
MPRADYYAFLQVPPTATQSEIKRSYRRLARQYHPDLNEQALDEHIKMLNEAYTVLRDPQKRALYDAQRRQAQERRTADQHTLRRQQAQAKQEAKMTWVEGVFGFIRELKKGMRED